MCSLSSLFSRQVLEDSLHLSTAIANCLTYSNMSVDPFVLTFGIELEFIIRYNPEDYDLERLAAKGKSWPIEYGLPISRQMIQVLNENGFSTNDSKITDFSKWTVTTDSTVFPYDLSENWYAIELKTPVLVCSALSLNQVETVVNLLVSKFQLYTNGTCGLHVHVGNENRGFDLDTLKNFCSLITAFEHQLNSLHSPDRLKYPFLKPMKMGFNLSASPRKKLSIINDLETLHDLIILFHRREDDADDYDRNFAFNFLNLSNLHQNVDEPLRTIEFRQHRGTLDPNLITNWITMAYKLIDVSYNGRAGLRDLIEKHIDNTKYTAMDLFNDLNLSELAEFYTPLVTQYVVDDNPALVDEFKDDEESRCTNTSCPLNNYTSWEKEFAPRPPSELLSSCHSSHQALDRTSSRTSW